MPLHVRAGAIVPLGPVKQYVDEAVDAPLEVVVYPGADGAFAIYEDDGKTFDYRKGAWMRTAMTWNDATRTLSIRLAPKSRMLPPAKRADRRPSRRRQGHAPRRVRGQADHGSLLIATRLPHAVGVDRFGRDLLAEVPQLDDPIVHEPEDVDHDRAAIAGLLPHEGVDSDQMAVLQRAQHFQPFLGVLTARSRPSR